VTLCLADVARRTVGWWPRGSLAGLATAVKLTPAVFWIHWAVTRQWRVLGASVLTAASVTAVTGLFAPSATAAFWTDALLDPGRLGPNDGTSNQSIRGVLLRLGPSEGPLLTLLWALLVVVVAVLGFRLSARLHRLGRPVAVVATVGLVAFLVSPVSWVHHLHWGIVVLGALVGDGRDVRRVALAALGTVVLYSKIPQTGFNWTLSDSPWKSALGPFLEQSYCWWALVAMAALWWFLARDEGGHPVPAGGRGDGGTRAGQNGVGTPAAASSVRAASTAQTPAPILRMRDSRILRSRARPSSAATPETTSSAASDPANTETGSR
jgi:alpha-1,2-mannosyltransferase